MARKGSYLLFENSLAAGGESAVREEQRLGLDGKPVKRLIIEGCAIVCGVPGINGREYPLAIIKREVDRLNREAVPYGRLAAELNHPRLDENGNSRDYPICEIDLSKLCAVVEELRMDGNKLYCRMVVAEDTDAGRNLAGSIRAGFRPGYSLRGAGETIPKGDHEVVTDDYTMITIDVVGNPSFGKSAIVTARTEAAAKPNLKAITESIDRLGREVAMNHGLADRGYHCYDKNEFISYIRGKV